MKQVDDFLENLTEMDNEDLSSTHTFSFKAPDSCDDIERLTSRLGFATPENLQALWLGEGAFHHPCFADVWQTLELYSAKEMLNRAIGLVDFIDQAWGDRPELRQKFSAQDIATLNANYFVFGYRYEDDNTHDYLFFNREGNFGHLHFDQDQIGRAFTDMSTLLASVDSPQVGDELKDLLNEQLNSILEALETDYD